MRRSSVIHDTPPKITTCVHRYHHPKTSPVFYYGILIKCICYFFVYFLVFTAPVFIDTWYIFL